jgi:hypothetical protein
MNIVFFLALAGDPSLARPAQAELSHPTEKRCLEGGGLAALLGEQILDGLSREQVVRGMDPILPELLRCSVPGESVSARLEVQLEVACTGTVRSVQVTDGGGQDPELLLCLSNTLSYAEFDAHDMVDGYAFGYTLRLDLPPAAVASL